jgi:hypothetical protein
MDANQIVDRESYVKFRRDWKAVYSYITEEIRSSKRASNSMNWRRNSISMVKTHSRGQAETAMLSRRANALMQELTEAKARRPLRSVA